MDDRVIKINVFLFDWSDVIAILVLRMAFSVFVSQYRNLPHCRRFNVNEFKRVDFFRN